MFSLHLCMGLDGLHLRLHWDGIIGSRDCERRHEGAPCGFTAKNVVHLGDFGSHLDAFENEDTFHVRENVRKAACVVRFHGV